MHQAAQAATKRCWNFKTIYGAAKKRVGIGLSYRPPAMQHGLTDRYDYAVSNRFLAPIDCF